MIRLVAVISAVSEPDVSGNLPVVFPTSAFQQRGGSSQRALWARRWSVTSASCFLAFPRYFVAWCKLLIPRRPFLDQQFGILWHRSWIGIYALRKNSIHSYFSPRAQTWRSPAQAKEQIPARLCETARPCPLYCPCVATSPVTLPGLSLLSLLLSFFGRGLC